MRLGVVEQETARITIDRLLPFEFSHQLCGLLHLQVRHRPGLRQVL